jgi:hypothetical protein
MSIELCWALGADRARCAAPAAPGSFFCDHHSRGHSPHPVDIFCRPEREMPPGLVALIRSQCPAWPFPQAAPETITFAACPSAALRSPTAAPAGPAPPPAQPVAAAAPQPRVNEVSSSEPDPLSTEWLLTLLKETMEAVRVAKADPLRQANAVARLTSLYLKVSGFPALQMANRELTRRVAALEKQLAVVLSSPQEAPQTPAPVSTPRGRATSRLPRRAHGDPSPPPAPPPTVAPAVVMDQTYRDVGPRAKPLAAAVAGHAPP